MAEREEQFRDLYDRAYAAVCAYALRRAGPDDAMDVVAETMLIAWRRLEDVPSDAELPWMYGTARRVLANQRRGIRRRDALHRRVAEEVVPAVIEPAPDPALGDALRSLRADDRELLQLVAWEGLRVTEVAVALGCTTNAASIRLHRARERLRAALDLGERSDDVGTQVARKDTADG